MCKSNGVISRSGQAASAPPTEVRSKSNGEVQIEASAPPMSMPRLGRATSEPPASASKEVCFTSVTVREYHRILGDNPSVTSGPPISLSWRYSEDRYGERSIDEWEEMRCSVRRSKNEFQVPKDVRTKWLNDAGHSAKEIRDAVFTINQERKQRRSSISKSSLHDKAEIVSETFRRRMARAVGKREKSDSLYTKWKEGQQDQPTYMMSRRASL